MSYRPGERVKLVHTTDPHTMLRPGDQGSVTRHDTRAGDVVHIAWDNGSRLSMCLDAGDQVRRIPAPSTADMPGSDPDDPADTHQPGPVSEVTELAVPGLLTLDLGGGVRVSLVPRPDGAAHIGVSHSGRVFAVTLSAEQVQAVRAALNQAALARACPA